MLHFLRTLPPWTLDFWQKRELLMHEDATIRDAARALLEETPEDLKRWMGVRSDARQK